MARPLMEEVQDAHAEDPGNGGQAPPQGVEAAEQQRDGGGGPLGRGAEGGAGVHGGSLCGRMHTARCCGRGREASTG